VTNCLLSPSIQGPSISPVNDQYHLQSPWLTMLLTIILCVYGGINGKGMCYPPEWRTLVLPRPSRRWCSPLDWVPAHRPPPTHPSCRCAWTAPTPQCGSAAAPSSPSQTGLPSLSPRHTVHKELILYCEIILVCGHTISWFKGIEHYYGNLISWISN